MPGGTKRLKCLVSGFNQSLLKIPHAESAFSPAWANGQPFATEFGGLGGHTAGEPLVERAVVANRAPVGRDFVAAHDGVDIERFRNKDRPIAKALLHVGRNGHGLAVIRVLGFELAAARFYRPRVSRISSPCALRIFIARSVAQPTLNIDSSCVAHPPNGGIS